MKHLLRTMQSAINRTQRNRPRTREDQESKTVFLGLALPGMRFLEVLEGVDAEEEFGDREKEHDAEEDGDVC